MISRTLAVSVMFLMIFSGSIGMASASISPEIRANMNAYYTHEAPEMVAGPEDDGTGPRDDGRAIIKNFDIGVSLGWDASQNDFQTWETEVKNANKKLYDGTDGQMVFRKVHIYNNKDHWNTVDVHINNANGRAYTYRGGIQWSNLYIELFRNDAGMGGKVLQHEWGHYGLFLPDEYTDSYGPFCKCTMGTTYNTNEWCCESNHCDYAPSYCASHGEANSCWKQMKQYYPGLTEKDPPVAGPYDAPTPEFIWHYPDLHTSDSRLRIAPSDPLTGEEVKIEVDIYNKENLVKKAVDIGFYDGAVSSSNLIHMQSVYISSSVTTVSQTWTATPGAHTITVKVDPANKISEISDNNNTASKVIMVNSPPEISSTLKEFRAQEDEDQTIDLTKYEHDYEDGDDSTDLKWTVTDHDTSVIEKIDGENSADDILTFKVAPDWNGKTTVELTLTDSVGLTDSKDVDLIWNAVNDAPLVDSLTLSLDSVMRTDYLVITMTGSDIEDPTSGLTSEIEYKPSTIGFWTMMTVIPTGEHFEASLYTDEFFQVGYYDVRGRLTDSEVLSSEWYYLNSTLEIRNNLPEIISVMFEDEPESIYRTEELVIMIAAMDLETPGAYLTPMVEISLCGDDSWEPIETEDDPEFLDDYWEVRYVPSKDLETGDYCLMVYVLDDEGDRSLYYLTDEIEVLNNQPQVTSIEMSDDEVLRNKFLTMTVKGEDIEDDGKDLTLKINYKHERGSWEEAYIDTISYSPSTDSWTARFMPPKNARTGEYHFSARLTDSEEASGEWFEPADVGVDVKNNDPVAVIAPVKTLTAGTSGTFSASGSSDLEDKGLSYSWDYGDKKKGTGIKSSHSYAKGGKYTVTLTVTDSDGGTATATTEVTVRDKTIFSSDDDGGGMVLGAAAIGGILALIIVIMIVLLIVMRKRKAARELKALEGPAEGPGMMDPTIPKDPDYKVEGHPFYDPNIVEGPKAYGEEEKERYYK